MMSMKEQKGGNNANASKPDRKGVGGRKSKYYTHIQPYLEHIAQFRRNGLTVDQIAERFKVGTSTLMDYQTKFPELRECLKENAELAIVAVENALFLNATKHNNLSAQIFYLKNRASKNWRDKQHVFQTSSTTVRKDYEHMSDDELEREMELLDGIVPEDIENIEGGEVH